MLIQKMLFSWRLADITAIASAFRFDDRELPVAFFPG